MGFITTSEAFFLRLTLIFGKPSQHSLADYRLQFGISLIREKPYRLRRLGKLSYGNDQIRYVGWSLYPNSYRSNRFDY